MSYQNSASDFFLTPYRAWEFLGGSLLAWWHYGDGVTSGHEEDVPHYREALSIGGAILLAMGMGLIHKETPYPGWRALLPVGGTLMLMEGGRGAWVNRKILSNPAVVWIGLISYPLYLFHWPALSFVHIVKGENPNTGYIVAALGVSLLLTIFTYYFIEKKLRHNKSNWVLPALVGTFIVMGVLGILGWKSIIRPNAPIKTCKIAVALADQAYHAGLKIHPSPVMHCTVGGNGPQTIYLGDSNMQQYEQRIAKLISGNPAKSRGAIFITCGGIPPIPGYEVYKSRVGQKMMTEFNSIIHTDSRIDRVVISALWPAYFKIKNRLNTIDGKSIAEKDSLDKAIKNLGYMIANLISCKKKVVIVLGIPTGDQLEPRNSLYRDFCGLSFNPIKPFTKAEFLGPTEAVFTKIRETALANGAQVIDPLDYLCTNGICIFENDDGPIRYNSVHLRPGYVREHVKYLDETVAP
jgi:hypothetical protein